MKLYYSKGSCSLAVRIVINEIGLSSEYESVNLKTKQTETGADFLKVNPKGAVPTLITNDGLILTENAVIQQYLADHADSDFLLPKIGENDRYQVLEWLNFVATDMHKGAGILFNANLSPQIKEDIFIPLLKKKLDFINQHLIHKKYLLGEKFTLPDAYLFVVLSWLAYFNIALNEWPHIERYVNELKQRDAIQKSLKEEGLIK